MIVNGKSLIFTKPISPIICEKNVSHGVSHGLSYAGYDIRIKQSVTLHPFRRFKLASTIEHFSMPTNLVGIVHDKSTWARQGLSVFNTVVESGWRGWLTLELVYHGWGVLRIPAGAGIAQVVFHQTTDRSEYRGKYNNQPDEPVEAIMEYKL